MYKQNELKLIDVTLRDGGYVNNFNYSKSQVIEIVQLLDKGNVNFIELGYCKGSPFDLANCGLTSNITAELLVELKAVTQQAKLGVMAHPKNVNGDDLALLAAAGLDLVRICVTPDNIKLALRLIRSAKALGLTVSANFVRMSRYQLSEVITAMQDCEREGVDMIYIADSLGNLQPKKVVSLISGMKALLNCAIGFHAHDNLGLANFNTISAIEQGASIIDSSLQGMGKGGGNLRTEVIAHILKQSGVTLRKPLKLNYLIEAASKVQLFVSDNKEHDALFQTYLAINNLSYEEGVRIREQARTVANGNWVNVVNL